jgi:hypothetical protein
MGYYEGSAAFSLRPQHRLNYYVITSVSGNTTRFAWSFSINTSGNTRQPWGTGTYNNNSANTDYVSGTTNTQQSFSYDYRTNLNRDYNFSGGVRSAPRGSGSRNFSLSVTMGNLIGSASVSLSIPLEPAEVVVPPENPHDGAISVVSRASNSITVGWFTTENPTSVEVRRDGILLSTALNDFSFLDAGRTPDTQYNYTLLARKTNFPDVTDSVVTRTRRTAPTLAITATALTSTTASVSWTSSNADSVSITGTGISSTDLNGSVTVTGLSPSTVYRWDGSASNVDSLDSQSQTVNVQSNSIQTPATLGGIWNGTQWAFPTLKAYNGSDWVTGSAYVYDGTNWKKWV